MGALDLPSADVSINAQANAGGAGSGYIAIITPVATLDDGVPRLYASGAAALAVHGYSPGIAYGALHAVRTRRPFLVVPIAIAVDGESSAVIATAAPTGTCVVTITDGAAGTLEDADWTLTVKTAGTIATAGIVLTLSDGYISKTIRLGTANSYLVPDLGFTIAFSAGTLVADEYLTWTTTAGAIDTTGVTLARTGLAATQYKVRTWLADTRLTVTNAGLVNAAATAYASSNERFVMARGATTDLSESTWALEAAALAASYAAVNSTDGRLSLGFGFRRVVCPMTGWGFRRSVAWFASLVEYRRDRDIHNTTWHRARGALEGCILGSDDTEHDERNDSGALAGRFTCFTTLANGTGTYIAKDLTRAADDSTLLLPNNAQVTNEVCRIVSAETTRIIGGDVIKNSDGTIDANQAVDIEEAVNGALYRGILREHVKGRGPRASACRWTASRDDDLRGGAAVMTGVAKLNLRGVISSVLTEVVVS